MKDFTKKIKQWLWMLILAYMLGIVKPYRDEELMTPKEIEFRLSEDEQDLLSSFYIGVNQITYPEALFSYKTSFSYFPRN